MVSELYLKKNTNNICSLKKREKKFILMSIFMYTENSQMMRYLNIEQNLGEMLSLEPEHLLKNSLAESQSIFVFR